MVERLISAKTRENEEEIDQTLRPRRLSEYIGQEKLKEHVRIMLEAARGRGEVLDHLLFYGPPGLGETPIWRVFGNEIDVPVRSSCAPATGHAGELASILPKL